MNDDPNQTAFMFIFNNLADTFIQSILQMKRNNRSS